MRIKGTKNKVKIDLNGKLIVWKDFKKRFSYFERSETATTARSAVGDVEAKRILTFFSLNPLESILLLGHVVEMIG